MKQKYYLLFIFLFFPGIPLFAASSGNSITTDSPPQSITQNAIKIECVGFDKESTILLTSIVNSNLKNSPNQITREMLKNILLQICNTDRFNDIIVSFSDDTIRITGKTNVTIKDVEIHWSDLALRILEEVKVTAILDSMGISKGEKINPEKLNSLESRISAAIAQACKSLGFDTYIKLSLKNVAENEGIVVVDLVFGNTPFIKPFNCIITGNNNLPSWKILGRIFKGVSKIFLNAKSEINEESILTSIVKLYEENGYFDCKILSHKLFLLPAGKCKYFIEIEEGKKYFSGPITILDVGAQFEDTNRAMKQEEFQGVSDLIYKAIGKNHFLTPSDSEFNILASQIENVLLDNNRVGSQLNLYRIVDNTTKTVSYFFAVKAGFSNPVISEVKLLGSAITSKQAAAIVGLKRGDTFNIQKVNDIHSILRSIEYVKNVEINFNLLSDNSLVITYDVKTLSPAERIKANVGLEVNLAGGDRGRGRLYFKDSHFLNAISLSIDQQFLTFSKNLPKFINDVRTGQIKQLLKLQLAVEAAKAIFTSRPTVLKVNFARESRAIAATQPIVINSHNVIVLGGKVAQIIEEDLKNMKKVAAEFFKAKEKHPELKEIYNKALEILKIQVGSSSSIQTSFNASLRSDYTSSKCSFPYTTNGFNGSIGANIVPSVDVVKFYAVGQYYTDVYDTFIVNIQGRYSSLYKYRNSQEPFSFMALSQNTARFANDTETYTANNLIMSQNENDSYSYTILGNISYLHGCINARFPLFFGKFSSLSPKDLILTLYSEAILPINLPKELDKIRQSFQINELLEKCQFFLGNKLAIAYGFVLSIPLPIVRSIEFGMCNIPDKDNNRVWNFIMHLGGTRFLVDYDD